MKKILKWIITIAIVIAIVFGVKSCVNKSTTSTKVYDSLTTSALSKINSAAMTNNLSELVAYVENHKNDSNFPAQVKTSFESGEIHSLLSLYSECSGFVDELKTVSALQSKATNSLALIKEQLTKTTDSMDALQTIVQTFMSYLNSSTTLSEDNFNYYYKQVESGVNDTLKNYASLAKHLADFAHEDVLDSVIVEADFALVYLKSNILYFACQNTTLLNDYATLKTNLSSINQQEFLVQLNNCDDVRTLLSSTDKQEFLKNHDTESYKYLAKVLFNVELNSTPVEEGAV